MRGRDYSAIRAGRRALVGLLLGGLLLAGMVPAGPADQPPKELTAEQRARLEKEARALSQRADQFYRKGQYGEAARLLERAVKKWERLYPAARYPDGHPDLAQTLNDLGFMLQDMGHFGQALLYYQKSLAMRQKLYPAARYPQGHPDLAESLNNLGSLFRAWGKYGQALPYCQKTLVMCQKLYPPARYPQGHSHLAMSLDNLGILLQAQGEYGKALPYYQKALAMLEKLYPAARYPAGHPHLASSLNHLGGLLDARGEYGKALPYYERALAMYRKLYPPARFPDGHPDLAQSLSNLGESLHAQGEYGKALPFYERALAMREKLYPPARYPAGHFLLAQSLSNLGALLGAQGEYGQALPYFEKALAMYQRLYPASRYPQGHPDLATSLNNLGILLHARGLYGQALPYFERALAMGQRLYPASRYPQGHPHLAASFGNLGSLNQARGEYGQALPYCEKALAMYQKLYPAARYPDGHPHLALSLNNLGSLLHDMGEYGKALPYYERALAMRQKQLGAFAEQAAEAEALALLRSLPLTRDALLSLTAHLPGREAVAYRAVWGSKGALTRVLRRRHLAALAARESSETKRRWQELVDTRRRLARLLAAPARDVAAQDKGVRELTDRKEKLERQLAAALPRPARPFLRAGRGPEELGKRLPAHTAFVDLLRYTRFEQDPKVRGTKGEGRTPHYTAFLLAPGRPVRRIELGPAAAIEKALRQWRGDIARGKEGPAAGELSRLLWRPIAGQLPGGTRALYLSPDEDLAGLPWGALPLGKGEVLLEQYAVAVVPHGPFLLDQLLRPAGKEKGPGRLLALGGVEYGAPRVPRRGYPALPGTRAEMEGVAALAGKHPVVRLEGSGATSARLLGELPRARYAHLATHGFFNEAAYREEGERQARLWHSWQFQQNQTTERVGLGARNPLGFTGLVLAGANRPDPKEGAAAIVTGESLVELPLEGLELAVLSACESGLGARSAGGEVNGLQRAFHLVGCRNVVCSLWPVPDVPTLVLMEQFYRRLWDDKHPLPPAEALRQAQLAVLKDPGLVLRRAGALKAELAKRGVTEAELQTRGFGKVLAQLPEGGKEGVARRSPPLWWAGFVLSGPGR